MTGTNYIYKRGVGWVVESLPAEKYQHHDLTLWTTADGRVLRVCDMDEKHVRNAMNKVKKTLAKMDPALCDIVQSNCKLCNPVGYRQLEARVASLADELDRRRDARVRALPTGIYFHSICGTRMPTRDRFVVDYCDFCRCPIGADFSVRV